MSTKIEANREGEQPEIQYQKGVKYLCDSGVTRVPNKYILPASDRPGLTRDDNQSGNPNLKLPIIDFAHLQGPNRSHALNTLAKACEEYGFFQLTNHGIPSEVILNMVEASKGFFELPFEERSKYMSANMYAQLGMEQVLTRTRNYIFNNRSIN